MSLMNILENEPKMTFGVILLVRSSPKLIPSARDLIVNRNIWSEWIKDGDIFIGVE